MNRASLEALIARNAEACENAKHPICTCHCGGAMHGKPHGQAWVRQQADLVELGQAIVASLEPIRQTELFD